MINNSEHIKDIDIYTHDIYKYADEYNLLIKDLSNVNDKYLNKSFIAMLIYIHDRIEPIDLNNIELLDKIFNTFTCLCFKYNLLPTIQAFSFLSGLSNATFNDWLQGNTRNSSPIYFQTAQKWFDICKNATISELNNTYGTNANMIFIAKAAYGMAETAPVQIQSTSAPVLTAADIKAELLIQKNSEQIGEQND